MSQAVRVITLTMDGRDISARGDQTILQVARENNMYIPTLCHLTGLSRVGACRLCLVEVKGINKLLPACITQVAEGMEVTLNSERLSKYRRSILELLFSERKTRSDPPQPRRAWVETNEPAVGHEVDGILR